LTASINLSPTIWTLFSLQWASRPLLNTSNENKILVSRCIMIKEKRQPAEVVEILHDSGNEVIADADDDEIGYEQEISRHGRAGSSDRARLCALLRN
jgi:hypothetical protein